MKLQTETVVVLGAIVVVVGGAWFLGRKVGGGLIDAAGTVGAAINPLSDQNVFYKGASAVGDMVGSGPSMSLGSRIFEWLNPSAVAAEKALGQGGTVSLANEPMRQIDRILEREAGPVGADAPWFDPTPGLY